MEKIRSYKVKAENGVTVGVHAIVVLTQSQLNDRRHFVTPADGVPSGYRLEAPTMFKCGEVFKMVGDIPPTLAECLVDAGSGAAVKASPPPPRRPAAAAATGKAGSDE